MTMFLNIIPLSDINLNFEKTAKLLNKSEQA
jgi:hypothetical protein